MGKARSERWWRETITAREESNETVKAFCARLGVSAGSFYRWRKEFSDKAGARSHFMPVRMVPTHAPADGCGQQPAASGIEVVLASGHRIRLKQGFDALTLRQAAAALEGVAC